MALELVSNRLRTFARGLLPVIHAVVLSFTALAMTPPITSGQTVEWTAVDAAMGRQGQMQDGGAYRFAFPRNDLTVRSRGVAIRPALSLGGWVAFKQASGNEVVAMGDLVLTEDEVGPVLARLQQGGIGQTAIHKHLPEHTPALWWTHVHGHGNPVELARTVREALALTGIPTPGPAVASAIALDTARIARILGLTGRVNGGVYQVSVARSETIRSMGIEVPPSMGVATAINFQPTTGGNAVVNGDFSMVTAEVDAVVAALRAADIEVVSLHNHLSDEEPRLMFLHFWAQGDAEALARGLRSALDRTNVRRGM